MVSLGQKTTLPQRKKRDKGRGEWGENEMGGEGERKSEYKEHLKRDSRGQ